MTDITAAKLRPGDVLEPDGSKIIKVEPDDRGMLAVTMKEGGNNKPMRVYRLDPNWPLRRRD